MPRSSFRSCLTPEAAAHSRAVTVTRDVHMGNSRTIIALREEGTELGPSQVSVGY